MKRPLLRYHGGKFQLSKHIISNFPNHSVYVEPYGGAASVLLNKPRSYAEIYNDLDSELVNLFRVVRENGEKLKRALELTPFSRAEFILSYEPADHPLEQARRTVVRSFMGHGSNAHFKKTGFRSYSGINRGSTPAQDWTTYPSALDAIIERMKGVIIENKDALEVMQAHDSPFTLHYIDPPYHPTTRDAGKDYRHEMDEKDHETLLTFLMRLKGKIVLSGYENELYSDVLRDWWKVYKKASADGGRERVEVLWMSQSCLSPDLFGLMEQIYPRYCMTENTAFTSPR